MDQTKLSVWEKNYTFLFISRLIKISADCFAFNSILWFLIFDGKGAIGTSLLLAVTFLPEAFLAPITGPLVKRSALKFWMYFSDLTRADRRHYYTDLLFKRLFTDVVCFRPHDHPFGNRRDI